MTFAMPMYHDFVPKWIRPWIYVVLAFCFQLSNGMYLGAMNNIVGEWGIMREDVQMCLYATLIGMALYFPVLFRMKFRFSNKLLLIKHENERLAKGENPVVLLEDDHALHIKEHASVLASITARETEAVVLAVQAHNDYHLRMRREADPQLLAYMGQQSAAMPTAPGATSATPPPSGEPKPPEAPSMPTNPSSGEKAEPAGGMKPPALAIKPN